MSVIPRKLLEKIQWAESHVEPFNTNAVAIGTTVVEAAAFQDKTEAARAALTAADAARNASKDASLTLKNAIAAMDIAAQGIVEQVRVKAKTTNNTGVYALASIPAPALPSPVAPPGTPSHLAVVLNGDGTLILTWRCENPSGASGTMYQVFRSNSGSDGDYIYLGGTGEKRFTDETVPAGATSLTYKIQAVRSTAAGMWATFNVFFGANSSGQMTASVTDTTPALAA
jgi:hypothetical protein